MAKAFAWSFLSISHLSRTGAPCLERLGLEGHLSLYSTSVLCFERWKVLQMSLTCSYSPRHVETGGGSVSSLWTKMRWFLKDVGMANGKFALFPLVVLCFMPTQMKGDCQHLILTDRISRVRARSMAERSQLCPGILIFHVCKAAAISVERDYRSHQLMSLRFSCLLPAY